MSRLPPRFNILKYLLIGFARVLIYETDVFSMYLVIETIYLDDIKNNFVGMSSTNILFIK